MLVTDGDDNASKLDPRKAAKFAQTFGVKVFTILIGRDVLAAEAPPGQDRFGNLIRPQPRYPVNPKLLEEIAETTGGMPFLATDTEALEKRFQAILEDLDRSQAEGADAALRRALPDADRAGAHAGAARDPVVADALSEVPVTWGDFQRLVAAARSCRSSSWPTRSTGSGGGACSSASAAPPMIARMTATLLAGAPSLARGAARRRRGAAGAGAGAAAGAGARQADREPRARPRGRARLLQVDAGARHLSDAARPRQGRARRASSIRSRAIAWAWSPSPARPCPIRSPSTTKRPSCSGATLRPTTCRSAAPTSGARWRASTEELVRVRAREGKKRPAQVILLITDGEDTEGRGVEAAKKAAALGIKIYTLGIGSNEKPPVPLFDEDGKQHGYVTDENGEPVRVGLDDRVAQADRGHRRRRVRGARSAALRRRARAGGDRQPGAHRRGGALRARAGRRRAHGSSCRRS